MSKKIDFEGMPKELKDFLNSLNRLKVEQPSAHSQQNNRDGLRLPNIFEIILNDTLFENEKEQKPEVKPEVKPVVEPEVGQSERREVRQNGEKILINGENRIFGKETEDGLIIYIPLLGASMITMIIEDNILKFLVETSEIKIRLIKGYQDTASFVDMVEFKVEDVSKYEFGKVESRKDEKEFQLFVPLKSNDFLNQRVF